MAERQVALVPTMVQLENFESYAAGGGGQVPDVRRAHAAPCTPAGSSAFAARVRRRACRSTPAPTPAATCRTGWSAREMAALAAVQLDRRTRWGPGSWRARAWLGRPDALVEGAPADLVVFDADPRLDLGVLRTPRQVVLRGVRTVG